MGRVVPLCVYWIDARLIFCKSKDIFPDVRAANSAGRIELSKVGHGITRTVRLTRKHAPHHQHYKAYIITLTKIGHEP